MKNSLSLTLIVKNEEKTLDRILKNAHLYADEIVIVDTGSNDQTKEIAKKYTDKVYDFVWCDDFSKARNFGIEKCSMDFVMWIDADDVISDENARKIKQLFIAPIEWDVCYIPYNVTYDSRGNVTQSLSRERIFRNNRGILFLLPIHEQLNCNRTQKFKLVKNISVDHQPTVEKNTEKMAENRNFTILKKVTQQPEYSDSPTLWGHLAKEYAIRKNTENAIYAYQTALEKNELNKEFINRSALSRIHYELGVQLCIKKETDAALHHFGIAMAIHPLWREPVFECGRLLFLLKRPREALQMFLFCQTIPLNTFDYIDTQIYDGPVFYDWLSLVYAALGEFKIAIKSVKKALTFMPNDAKMLSNKSAWEKIINNAGVRITN